MKYKIKYFSLLGVLLVINSRCEMDNLTVNPSDQFSEETFWKSDVKADAGLTGCYNILYYAYSTTITPANPWDIKLDWLTPNMVANMTVGYDEIARGSHTALASVPIDFIGGRWLTGYRGIGTTNTFLAKIDGVTMDEQKKNIMVGEAKFLRAFFYFNLVDYFGGVPLILDPPDATTQSDLPRDSKEKVVEQIIKDLDEASLVLPTNASATGRVTKGAALALKARVLLYNGMWEQAANTAKEVMNLNVYSLFPDYRELFLLRNEHNSEVIFNVELLVPRFCNNNDLLAMQYSMLSPTKNIVDAYLMKDGKTITNSPLYDPNNPYENRDPRFLQTIACIGYKFNGRIIKSTDALVNCSGFTVKKYTCHEDETFTPLANSQSSEINPIVIRYAEVLLTYAEAQNEFNGPDASVYSALNKIRKRPSVNMPDVEPGLTKDQMREVICNERRIELAFEGLYYSDIRRWKTAEVDMNKPLYNYKGVIIKYRSFNKDRDYLWPIPFEQIQINPNLEQNPGY